MGEVKVSYTIGEVHLIRNGSDKKIEAIPLGNNSKWIRLKDGDRITTGAQSYVVEIIDNPGPNQNGSVITIFPNSVLVLEIKGALITKMELISGLFRIATGKEVITPTAELKIDISNVFWTDVAKDGSVTVASEAAPMEVTHKKSKRSFAVNSKQQVIVTQEDISEPCVVDERFKEAYKIWEMLEQSKAKFLYGDMLERNVPQKLQKLTKLVEEKTGRKQDYEADKYQKWLKEQKEFGEWKFDEVTEKKLPEFKTVKGEVILKPIIHKIDINKSINYQGIDFRITSLEKGQEFKGRNATEGKDFLALNVNAKNNSSKQVIIFPEEEIMLATNAGKTINLEHFKMETNFDPSAETEGFLLFLVAKEDKKFKLQFGKKIPFQEVSLVDDST